MIPTYMESSRKVTDLPLQMMRKSVPKIRPR